jgi:hypothetical protein
MPDPNVSKCVVWLIGWVIGPVSSAFARILHAFECWRSFITCLFEKEPEGFRAAPCSVIGECFPQLSNAISTRKIRIQQWPLRNTRASVLCCRRSRIPNRGYLRRKIDCSAGTSVFFIVSTCKRGWRKWVLVMIRLLYTVIIIQRSQLSLGQFFV